MTRNRIYDIARDEDNAPVVGASVSLRRLSDNAEIATTTTDAGGAYGFTEAEVGYPGPIKVRVTSLDGVTRERTGTSTGQTGTYFHSDLMRAFSVMNDGVVYGYDNELEVTADGVDREVTVDSGLAFVSGHPLFFPDATVVPITENASGSPRIDTIAVSFTMPGENEEGEADIIAVAGTPAGSPVAPTLTQTTALWQIRLADVAVANGASSIALGNVTDARTYSTGPLVDGSIETAALADGAVTDAKVATGIDAAKIANGAVSNTEFQYISGLTGDVQNQINDKADDSHTHLLADTTDVTATATEVNVLDGILATTAELNILDGLLATTAELNTLDGILATVTELNYTDGVTSAIQTQLDAKLGTTVAALLYASLGGATFTGDVTISDGDSLLIGSSSSVALTNSLGTLAVDADITTTANISAGVVSTTDNVNVQGDVVIGTATTGGKIRLPERTSQPTIAIGAAAGSSGDGATISMLRGGSDSAGTVRVSTATTGTTTGVICSVTFATARASTEFQVQVCGQSNDSGLGLYVSGISTTKFDVRCATAPGVSDTVDIAYLVIDMV